jgi:hypothetical protein
MKKLISTDIGYYPCETESLLDWRGMVLPRRHHAVLQNKNYDRQENISKTNCSLKCKKVL